MFMPLRSLWGGLDGMAITLSTTPTAVFGKGNSPPSQVSSSGFLLSLSSFSIDREQPLHQQQGQLASGGLLPPLKLAISQPKELPDLCKQQFSYRELLDSHPFNRWPQNIELKVEVESLKQELQEKQQSLDKAWTEAENQSNKDEAKICHQPKNKVVCENLEKKIQTLHELIVLI
ncbi:myomegalin [Crotalus adamanteus]|uniref:Myomegalin n=1 Tax=Crotalus adamanteus TaxID=8729 RepID=A0AAW1BQY1_CROAD